MKASITTQNFYDTNKAEITYTVGNLVPVPIGSLILLSSVDLNNNSANVYNLPEYLEAETDAEYKLRVEVEAVVTFNDVIAGTVDGLVFNEEQLNHLLSLFIVEVPYV